MKRLKNIGLWIAALLLLASCSKIAEPCYEKENEEVQLKIALDGLSAQSRAVATEADEAYIGTVQLFIFPVTADKSGVAERIVTLNADKGTTDDMLNTWNSATGIFTLRGLTGSKTVYVVANGTTANGYDPTSFIEGATTEQNLLDVSTPRQGQIAPPTLNGVGLLMAGSVDVDFTTATTATIPLVRQVAKIKLHVTFDNTFSDSYPAMKFGEASISPATVTAYNVPTHSYIVAPHTPALPAATLLGDYKAINFAHIGAETARAWESDVYVYENPQTGVSEADKKLSTQFVVSIPYTDGTTATVYANSYLVYINDPAAAASPHKTLRNNLYKVNVTVKGFGSAVPEVDRTTVTTEVLPWNVANSEQSVGDFLKISKPNVEMLEMDEEVTITYTGGTPTSITFDDVLKDKIETTVTKDAANSGKITFKRKDVVHDGQKHSGVMTIKCSSPMSYSINVPVSIEQYSVNIGGRLTTSADGLKKYWSGGINWATGNLTIQNPAQNKGMTISTDPYNMQNKDMYFKFQSRVAVYENFSTSFNLYDGSGTAMTRNLWSDVLAVYYNEDPCKNAAQIPGEAGVYGGSNPYWRQPTKLEAEDLVKNIPVNGERIAVYNSRLGFAHTTVLDWHINGALAMSGSNNWTSSVINTAGSDSNMWTAYSFHAGAHMMQIQCVNYGFYVRCVRNNTL